METNSTLALNFILSEALELLDEVWRTETEYCLFVGVSVLLLKNNQTKYKKKHKIKRRGYSKSDNRQISIITWYFDNNILYYRIVSKIFDLASQRIYHTTVFSTGIRISIISVHPTSI